MHQLSHTIRPAHRVGCPFAFIVAAGMIAVVAGCGRDASTAVTTTPAPVTTTPPTAPASAGASDWIAYQTDGGIAFVRPDGSETMRFPATDGRPHHPDWSPDGSTILYVVDETDGTSDIWVAAVDGSDARRVIDCQSPCEFAEDPTWSPDGTQLAYWTTGDDDPPLQQVIIADVATGETQTVVDAGALTGPVNPKFSPDGTQLALEVGTYALLGGDLRLTSSEIATVDLMAPTPKVVLITSGMLAGYPDWSPAGDQIVFQAGNVDPFSHDGVVPELYTVRPDGSELTKITNHGDGDPWLALPDWTSDPAMPILVTAIASSTNYSLATLSLADGQVTLLGGVAGPFPGAHPRRA